MWHICYNCDYLPHVKFRFYLIVFQLFIFQFPILRFLPQNDLALLKDRFLQKMLSKPPKTIYI